MDDAETWGDFVEEPIPTRDKLRAVLADPASSKHQIIEAKFILERRIAGGTDRVRQISEQYRLTPEKTEELLSSHQKNIGRIEAKAAEEVQRLEQLLKEMQD